MKLEFEVLNLASPYWWTETLRRQKAINDFIEKNGHSFYRLRTFEDQEYNVYLMRAEDGRLYLSTGSLSDYIRISKIHSLVVDEKARKERERIQGTAESEQFTRDWHRSSKSRWKVHV